MKQLSKRIDILILLGSLLILSMGIGILYAQLDTDQSLISMLRKPFASDQEILNVLSANLSARNVKEIGGLIRRVPLEQRLRLLETMIQNENLGLNRDDKLELILHVERAASQKNKKAFFNLLIQNPNLLIGSPVLYHAALSGNQDSIPDLLTWLLHNPERKEKWVMDAFVYAVENNRPNIMQTLFEKGVAVSGKEATELLWQAIQTNKDAKFAPLLVKKGALINGARKGITPLIAAVNTNNLAMVEALIASGVEINLIKDMAVGSALQNAVANGYTPIEMLLREKGARE